MENGYLYMPLYESDLPKPDVKGNSMASLCNNLDGIKGDECSSYVGDSYLSVQRRDISGAISQCKLLTEKK